MKTVTVFGSGNGGVTAAYHFAKRGYEVCLYDFEAFPAQIEAIRKNGGIRALGEDHGCAMILEGFENISCATCDIETAMRHSDLYVMICPSFAQEKFFAQMIPYLTEKSVVLTMPANYAGLVFQRMLKEAGKAELGVHFADAVSIPWACRLAEPGVTTIMGLKEFLPLSIFPKNGAESAEAAVRNLLPIPVEILDNPLIAGLENINFGGHPLMTVVNIGLLENFNGEFNYYRDCCSPATARAAAEMDRERLKVGEALGFKLRTELEAMNALYNMHETSVYDFNRKSQAHGKINNGPATSKARYISEDVPYVLVPVSLLGSLFGVDTKIVNACITLACAYNEEDYFSTGRTLEKMGLSGLGPSELKEIFSK